MDTLPRLSLRQAQLIQLAAQGLLTPPRRRARKADLLAAITRMRVLQIDTIQVVARSPYLVLYSRLGAYEPSWLDELLAEGGVFECWAHEACFAPIVDYALHAAHGRQDARGQHWAMRHAARVRRDQAAAVDALLAHVRAHGAVKSADFARPARGGGGWWGWKDEKRVLEALFATGELMVARRERFQRVYDLRERVLEQARARHVFDPRLPDATTLRREFTLGAVKALGITQARWINDYFRRGTRLRDDALADLVASGALLQIEVAGWEAPAYLHADHACLLAQARANRLRATHTSLLSPFDPLVWDRERAATVFGFDYRLECYTPAPRRRHGYFVLPLLRRGRLVGRLDAKAHRTAGVFEIKALYLEQGVTPDAALARDLARAIHDCARWHGTPRLRLGRCEPRAFGANLRAALQARTAQ